MTVQVLLGLQALVQLVLGVVPQSGAQVFLATVHVTQPLFEATAVVFLVWFRRCRLNAEVGGAGGHTYSPGMAVGSWFIPVLMWWAPWRATLDIWRVGGGDTNGVRLINAWWVAWLAKSVGVSVYLLTDLQGDPNAAWVVAVNTAAAGLAIAVVRSVSAAPECRDRRADGSCLSAEMASPAPSR